jgi:calcineurin-like phosphoesterase family protein
MKHFLADPHFQHERILQDFSIRDFPTIEDHDQHIIDKINEYVQHKDELWILGDFCWDDKPGKWREKINCREVHFIYGNHDSREKCSKAFSTCHDLRVIKIGGVKTVLCHYPMVYWDGSHHGNFHLYGHLHYYREEEMDRMMPGRRSMDVGVDAAYHRFGEYRPFSEDDIVEILGSKPGHHDTEYEREMEEKWSALKKGKE